MNRFFSIVIVAVFVSMVAPAPCQAQTKADGLRLLTDGTSLRKNHRSNRHLREAVEKLNRALEIFRDLGYREGVGDTFDALGDAHFDLREFDAAKSDYERALEISEGLGERKDQAERLSNLGDIYRVHGEFEKAAEYYRKSAAVRKELNDLRGQAWELINAGRAHQAGGEYESAENALEESLEIARKPEDTRQQVIALYYLGKLECARKKYEKASDRYEQSLAVAREIHDHMLQGGILWATGDLHELRFFSDDKGDYYYLSALCKFTEAGDWKTAAAVMNDLAEKFEKERNNLPALHFYGRIIALAREHEWQEVEASTLRDMGNLSTTMKDYDAALKHFRNAKQIYEKREDPANVGRSLLALARVYERRGDDEAALDRRKKALATFREADLKELEAYALYRVGRSYATMKRCNEALRCYEQALTLDRDLKLRNAEANTLRRMGECYVQLGEGEKALDILNESLDIMRDIGSKRGEAGLLGAIAAAYLEFGQPRKAIEFFAEAGETGAVRYTFEYLANLAYAHQEVGNLYTASSQLKQAESAWKRRSENAKEAVPQRLQEALSANQKALEEAGGVEAFLIKSLESAKAKRDRVEQRRLAWNLQNYYLRKRDLDKAIEYCLKSRDICKEIGDSRCERDALKTAARYSKITKNYEKAVEYQRDLLNPHIVADDPNIQAMELQSLASIYTAWGKADQAEHCYLGALQLAEESGTPGAVGSALSELGHFFSEQGRFRDALDYNKRALDISVELGDWSRQSDTVKDIARIRLQMVAKGDNNPPLTGVLGPTDDAEAQPRQSRLYRAMAKAYVELGRPDRAIPWYERSIAIDRRLGRGTSQVQSLSDLTELLLKTGRYREADATLTEWKALAERRHAPLDEMGATFFGAQHASRLGDYRKARAMLKDLIVNARPCLPEIGTFARLGVAGNEIAEGKPAQAKRTLLEIREDLKEIKGTTGECDALLATAHLDMGENDKAAELIEKLDSSLLKGRLCLARKEYDKALEDFEKLRAAAEKYSDVDHWFAALTGLGLAYEGLERYRDAAGCYKGALALIEAMSAHLDSVEKAKFLDVRIGGFRRSVPLEGVKRIAPHL